MKPVSPTIIDYAKVAIRWQKIILTNIFFITMIAVGISLISPKTYTANSILMPPESSGGNTLQDESNISIFSFTGLLDNMMDESMKLISILQSRTVMEKVIDKFKLMLFYDSDNIEEALDELMQIYKSYLGAETGVR